MNLTNCCCPAATQVWFTATTAVAADGCRWSQTKWRHALLIFIMHLHLSFGCTCCCINVIPFGITFGTLALFRTLSNVMRVCKVIYAVCVCVVRYAMVWSDLISSDVQQQQQQQQRLQLDRWFRFHRQLYTSLVRTESLNKQCINIYRGAGAAHWPHTHTHTEVCVLYIHFLQLLMAAVVVFVSTFLLFNLKYLLLFMPHDFLQF